MMRSSLQKWAAIVVSFALVLGWWALRTPADRSREGREELVFFAGWMVNQGDDI